MRHLILFLAVPLCLASGCTLKATTDEILDTTTNITGTTSSARSWFGEDGLVKPEFKLTAYVAFNQENLMRDLAAGHGEYLASAGDLLGIPAERRTAFFSAAQARYALDSGREPVTLMALLTSTAQSFLE
jgi:hypothetical protein